MPLRFSRLDVKQYFLLLVLHLLSSVEFRGSSENLRVQRKSDLSAEHHRTQQAPPPKNDITQLINS